MAVLTVPGIDLRSGDTIPVLGQGTWHLGQGRHSRAEEIRALREGVELGMTLIDTAEMYGDGASEKLVGEAIAGRRADVFLVSKVLPSHANRRGTTAACHGSLRRLATDQLDLYLLHWRGAIPLQETVEAFEELRAAGLIRNWGVSNFDLVDMERLLRLGGGGAQTDQVLYNLSRRGIELDLLPWCLQHGLPVMAYSPLEQGRLLDHPVLRGIAIQRRVSPAQVALAWVLARAGVCAIPEAGTAAHARQNRAALDLRLSELDMLKLDEAFPPPVSPQPLEIL
ncbi:MAG TPA: aldo/keto reductase [Solirubrobacteraceae bacterium]|jgi:diketogulonate reductase-like aldo/keto reductase|nr:aldo/keto reductase [Solirubrobacteraceae bacterium]